MNIDQIVKVCQEYDNELEVLCIVADKKSENSLEYIRWMIQQIPDFVKKGEIGKANRWLGFIQGVLWREEFYTIDEMRDHNRKSG